MLLNSFVRSVILSLLLTGILYAESPGVNFAWLEYSGEDANATPLAPGEYHNPILSGFYPDPSICQAGDDYYLINSTFAYFPGIPIFHSRDLVNWQQVGNVIHRPDQLRYARQGVSGGIFAPSIRFHDGTFYVICTMVGAEGNFIVTATNAAGPWSHPHSLHFEGIDPSLFFDDTGRAWIVNNGAPEGKPLYNGHRAIWLQEYDLATQTMTGPRTVLVNGGVDLSKKPIWIEGPHLFKKAGWYYLCCAEGGTGPQHSQVILRSKTVTGPYDPWDQNPILTQRGLNAQAAGAVTCAGHADLVEGPDHAWWAVFLGVRPYQGRFSPMGRETFLLPVQWTPDGWPVILPPGARVPLTAKTPAGAILQADTQEPHSGNFSWRDDFKTAALGPWWIMLRTTPTPWWQLAPGGGLILTPQAIDLAGNGNPSFLARRVQHSRFTATTALTPPTQAGISAGLAIFQNERHHYFLAVHRTGEELTLALECAHGEKPQLIASARIPATERIQLRARVYDAKGDFEYNATGTEWKTLATGADATLLTTEVAGGFVGATVGLHARLDADLGANTTATNIPEASTPATNRTVRIKAGNTAPWTDAQGHLWLAEQGFAGGDSLTHEPAVAVAGTPEPALYQSEHYGMSAFTYPLPNGKYTAKLYFAETYAGITGPGQRVFSFNVQGHEFKNFDVWAKAGGPNQAYAETIPVEVNQGSFHIDFTSQVENPQINAIEITPQTE